MLERKTSVCVKLMYILFFFPNEQWNCKLCIHTERCDNPQKAGILHRVLIILIYLENNIFAKTIFCIGHQLSRNHILLALHDTGSKVGESIFHLINQFSILLSGTICHINTVHQWFSNWSPRTPRGPRTKAKGSEK